LCLQILLIEGYRAHKEEKPLYLYAAACYKILIPFMFGAAVTQLTTDIAKYTVGRLRPHFLTVCMPNATVCASNTGRMSYRPLLSFEENCISNTGKDKAKLDANTEIERNCFAKTKHRGKKQKLDVNAELEKLFCPTKKKKKGKIKAKT